MRKTLSPESPRKAKPSFPCLSAPPPLCVNPTNPIRPMHPLKSIPELAHLTDAQLETLDGWLAELSLAQVVELVAEPAPEGFGLRVSGDNLRRHQLRRQILAQFQARQELIAKIEEQMPALQTQSIEDLCLEVLRQKSFELLQQPGHTAETLKILFEIATFRQNHALAERRLSLAEEKAGLKAPANPIGQQAVQAKEGFWNSGGRNLGPVDPE